MLKKHKVENCKFCKKKISRVFFDLGTAPPSNSYLTNNALRQEEVFLPLKVLVCTSCWLVQTFDCIKPNLIFSKNYSYLSSMSQSWLTHARNFITKLIKEKKIQKDSLVIEIASNDGYLLENLLPYKIKCLGIEPTKSTATIAKKKGIPVIMKFFSKELAEKLTKKGIKADLIIANNVYAHVPDIGDFTEGMELLIKDTGIITIEFPHILNLIKKIQFDTIYHEHYSYLSLITVSKIFKKYKLKVFDVEKLSTHGGSLRVYGCKSKNKRKISDRYFSLMSEEKKQKLDSIRTYENFHLHAEKIKMQFLSFLINQKISGKKIAAYGAAAKGSTLLNYCGIKPDLITCVYDVSPLKIGKYLPGSRIPISHPDKILEDKPDILIILPWNIKNEITNDLSFVRKWNGKFATIFPKIKLF
jgi:2-polyprenyl-3-methyl-5-hydroxy-6-metoxy-1,4-benzoquinol methylase